MFCFNKKTTYRTPSERLILSETLLFPVFFSKELTNKPSRLGAGNFYSSSSLLGESVCYL